MFTQDQIMNISKDEFSKLSAENKELILKILSEFKTDGMSQTLKELWEVDYKEIPVSIDEFICNPTYLGKSTRNGESIYPYWREKYREIFDPSKNYEEIVLTGAIGVGKTRTAIVCLCYLLYRLMCLKNPQEYFRFNEGDKITIFFLNITLTLAEGVGYETMHDYLIHSPWFVERGTITGRKNLRYNPPHNIAITFGSKGEHALGQQIFAAFLDEVDFKQGGIKGASALEASNAIMTAYRTIKARITSRFTKNNVLYGKLFLVSSKKSEHDFLEAYVQKMKSDKMLVVDEPQWVIKPKGTFDSRTFPVAVGNRSLKSRVLADDTSEEEKQALIKQGYRILEVPFNFKDNFKLDINTALMDLAGISVVGAVSFFNFDMFSQCYIKDYKNPFVTDILTIGIKDDLKISDFFELDKIPDAIKYMPQFIHIDGSLTGDKTGISSVGVSGLKETQQYNGSYEFTSTEMTYKHIFSVDIQAPQGSEISFEKTRNFIYYLKASGFNIVGVSLDGFQSADMKQMLIAQGYDATIISLDKTPQGYLALRSAMNDGRIGLIQIDLLETELIQLQRDVQTGRLDHPPDGCFTEDTLISLVDGRNVSIKDLLIEQEYKTNYVYTVNLEKGKIEPKPIKKVFQTKLVTDLVEVELDNGEIIRCTPEHRFMLRDGFYRMAKCLNANDSLMPLYTKTGKENNYDGYRYVYNPFTNDWNLEHIEFCNNVRKGNVVHHKNFIKCDNRPTNLVSLTRSEHLRIHNENTKDYSIVSDKVKLWHSKSKGTTSYEVRNAKLKDSTMRYFKNRYEDYVSRDELDQRRISKIEEIYGVEWDKLSCRERNSYSVKLTKNFPEFKKRRSVEIVDDKETTRRKLLGEKTSRKRWITDGVINKYIDKDDVIPDGFWYGRTQNIDKNHKVVSVRHIHKPCRVYDLEIQDNHNFALASGVFVHNSKDMADSLAGALFNASIHKQDLVDSRQLFSTAVDVNTEADPQQEFLDNMTDSMLAGSKLNSSSKVASDKLDDLLSSFGMDNIISF